jgi:hypothetical protein
MKMKHAILTATGVLLAALCLSPGVVAQSDVALETRSAKLQQLARDLRARDAGNRREVREFAQRVGIPARRVLPNGKVLEFQRFAPGIGPVIYVTYNLDAADSVSTDEVWPGGTAGLDLDGNGMTVGEWDGGAVAEHPDFDTRLTQVDGATEMSNHSTHVAGTLIGSGDGNYLQAKGMAYAAQLHAYDWNSDTAEMAIAAASGMLVSNHSYGIAAGWLYMGGLPPDQWWWIGGDQPGDVEDPNFGYYDAEASLWDQIAHDAPYYLVIKAAGNDRSDFGAAPGEEYTVIDQQGNFLFTSTLPRNPDCAPLGYDCLPGHSVAKNILTVGAADDLLGGYSPISGPAAVNMTEFSSWGPTDDGRIKPDLVGNGMWLFSTWGETPFWATAAGTSMAAPNVTGSLLLLQEHWQDLHGAGSKMRAATLKALAIHTADEAGNADGPDYAFGWGLLNTKSAANVISEEGNGHRIIEDSLPDSGLDSYEFTVSGSDATLTATLAWADPPATPVAPSLDPPDRMLINDLDLRVVKAPVTHQPWVLNPASPSDPATRGDNDRDNVEQVFIENAAPGVYSVQVSHDGVLLDGLPQAYSLIISEGVSFGGDSSFVIDEEFTNGMPPGWSLQSTTSLNWIVQVPDGQSTATTNNTGGSGNFAMLNAAFRGIPVVASLVTPLVDLSDASGVVLRFNNYFTYDLLETLNVDVSIDGGGSWTEVWEHCCGFLLAYTQVLDLSGLLAGESSVKIRFRFNTDFDGSGNLWQVDNIELEKIGGAGGPAKPDPAHSPSPADGATEQTTDTALGWTAGSGADSHDVYFGTGPIPAFQLNQSGTSYDPGTLAPDTTYYWRIDEVNEGGTTGGSTWSFTTAALPPPPPPDVTPMHLAGLDPSSAPAARGRWTATVTVRVEDDTGAPVSGVFAEGAWSDGTNGGASCTTGTGGACQVQKGNLKGNLGSVTFTLGNLSGSGMIYDAQANEVGTVIVVPQDAGSGNLLPDARDDAYTTTVDTPVNGNVMDNDDAGDAPATVTAFDATTIQGGSASVATDGAFTYTPPLGFSGDDSFGYTLTDANGDSDSATVVASVNAAPPPPPPDGDLELTATPVRFKGIWNTQLTWSGGAGDDLVLVYRDEVELTGSGTDNDGDYLDPVGKKPAASYHYRVCETVSLRCGEYTVQF